MDLEGLGDRGDYHQRELYKIVKELIKEREKNIEADVEHRSQESVSHCFKGKLHLEHGARPPAVGTGVCQSWFPW